MRLAVFTAFAALLLAPDAQAEPHESVADALADGIREVCLPSYGLSSMVASGVAREDAIEVLSSVEGWPVTGPIPDGIVPRRDRNVSPVYLAAAIAEGQAGRVVAVVDVSPEGPTCDLVALDAPSAAQDAIEDFRTRFTPLEVRGVGRGAGIDMFGLRVSEQAPDLGITVYTPSTNAIRTRSIGTMVSVGFIPREAIDTGIFDPSQY